MDVVTIVLGFRNRGMERVKRCLDSLSRQTFQDFRVVIVDYGSDVTISEQLKALIAGYRSCAYVYTDTRGFPWNRAHALNIGGRLATSEYLLASDIDMIFAENFVETLLNHAGHTRVLHCAPYWLPRRFSDWRNVEGYACKLLLGDRNQFGGCQCMSTTLFHEIQGFDEYYRYWGLEDHDLAYRLRSAELEEVWLDGHTSIFHQWHPKSNWRTRGFMPCQYWGRAVDHLMRYEGIMVRNGDDWGRIQKTEQRLVLRYLDVASSELADRDDLSVFDLPPDNNEAVGRLVERFWQLPSDHALAVDHAYYPRSGKLADGILRYLNSALRRLGANTGVDYGQNLVHSFVHEFVLDNRDMIADYYLGFPALHGVSVLVRA
jgi:GT2 family glycosyltransferase